jgi:hypothetical protein
VKERGGCSDKSFSRSARFTKKITTDPYLKEGIKAVRFL